MKKSELVTLVAEKTGFSKKDTEKTIDTVFTAIADIMAAGDKLQISGFLSLIQISEPTRHRIIAYSV